MSEQEPVGTLVDEAARLLSVVQAWLNEQIDPGAGPGGEAGAEATAEPAAEPTAESEDEAEAEPGAGGEHRHEDLSECRWCPLCGLARLAKATSPEVRDHLTQAAVSLALAVKQLLDDSERTPRQAVPLEKIDLTEE
jgi:hypothetical protein